MLPPKEEFPYTIRVVSDILESNGSSSMASVCGASLALMDAGVPLKAPVAGIAMGLVKEGDKVGILTDIMGTEDHYGDMDFKVAGTEKGITALQMDIKIAGVSIDIMRDGARSRRARRGCIVLGKMREALEKPRAELSPVRAALRDHQDPPGEDPRDHRPRRQGHPRHPGADRRQDRRRGRRQGDDLLARTTSRSRRRSA